jgi:hypothetical protein
MKTESLKTIMGYIAGLIFGLGLAVSGMTDPTRVLGFLDIAGSWDPTLIFVLGGAVVTNFIGYRLALRRSNPLYGEVFQLPTRKDLDTRLVSGESDAGQSLIPDATMTIAYNERRPRRFNSRDWANGRSVWPFWSRRAVELPAQGSMTTRGGNYNDQQVHHRWARPAAGRWPGRRSGHGAGRRR